MIPMSREELECKAGIYVSHEYMDDLLISFYQNENTYIFVKTEDIFKVVGSRSAQRIVRSPA